MFFCFLLLGMPQASAKWISIDGGVLGFWNVSALGCGAFGVEPSRLLLSRKICVESSVWNSGSDVALALALAGDFQTDLARGTVASQSSVPFCLRHLHLLRHI